MESSEQINTTDYNFQFCTELANHVLLEEAEKVSNFVISPLSFQIMLSLIATGTTGHTLDQLLLFLGSKNIESLNILASRVVELTTGQQHSTDDNHLVGSPLVTMVNGAWVDRSFGLKPSYEGILKDIYKAEAQAVDFAARAIEVTEEVNIWAAEATKGLITELLPMGSLGSDTALVFANALYFKGAWDRKFDSEKSMHKDFHLLTGEIIQVPYMTTKKKERDLYRKIYDYKILKLPYQNGHDTRKFALYIFLPGNTEKYGLKRPLVGPLQYKNTEGKTPVLDIGALQKIRSGEIKILPGIKKFSHHRVEFVDGEILDIDSVIFATGYRSNVPSWLKENILFSREGTPVAEYPHGWKGKDGIYAVGFTKRGLAGASSDAIRVSQDIGKIWKEETKKMKHSSVLIAGHRRCKSHV